MRVCTPAQVANQQQLFFDMRHVSRAFDQLGGESVRQFAEEQYDRGWHRRQHPRMVTIVGDPARGRILLVDVTEMNGHTRNGQQEAVWDVGVLILLCSGYGCQEKERIGRKRLDVGS